MVALLNCEPGWGLTCGDFFGEYNSQNAFLILLAYDWVFFAKLNVTTFTELWGEIPLQSEVYMPLLNLPHWIGVRVDVGNVLVGISINFRARLQGRGVRIGHCPWCQ